MTSKYVPNILHPAFRKGLKRIRNFKHMSNSIAVYGTNRVLKYLAESDPFVYVDTCKLPLNSLLLNL